jgi:hypothetical protein
VNKTARKLIAALVVVLAAETAGAQAGSAGPAPGSADSKAVVRDTQEVNAEYNRQAGAKDRKANRSKRATAATAQDLVAGSAVRDKAGTPIGTIESVDVTGVVVVSAAGKVKVPAEAFGKDRHGLLIQIGKAEFDAAVAQANASPNG